ncbi:hypothetical protein [Nitrosopumilus sp.]|uniref:hypothetical protein n=1 Tax=Nitrosopumilus sp. TaxID=2024843 RepID=UPI0034A025C0
MKVSILLEKLWIDKKEFVKSDELKKYCKTLNLDYTTTVKNFTHRGHLVRIFKGIFYVRPPEGLMFGKTKYNHLELVAKGLELKGVKNWYFGLHTALKHNNMTHEYFTIDEVISDSLFRAKPITIAGYKFKFVKISPSLLNFGIKKSNNTMLYYSDPEKTILDFVYLSTQDGVPANRVIMDVSEWSEKVSKEKLKKYSKNYPKTVAAVAEELSK